MKALTLWQPWATLVMRGAKLLETRSWAWHTAPPGTRLAIHAAQRFPREGRDACARGHFARLLRELDEEAGALLPRGVILGTVELVCHERTPDERLADAGFVLALLELHHPERGVHRLAQELAFGNYEPGRFAWVLRDPQLLDEPFPAKGRQRLWTVPPRLCAALAVAGPAP